MKIQAIVHDEGGENRVKSSLRILEKIGSQFTCAVHITGSAEHTGLLPSIKLNHCGTYSVHGTLGNEHDAYRFEPETCLENHQITQALHQFSR